MRDDPAVVDLVHRARSGDQAAWNAIVDRYAALLWSVCRRYRLSGADADEVIGSVWLRLVEHLDRIREPAALPGWLVQTTQRECLQLIKSQQRLRPTDVESFAADPLPGRAAAVDQELLVEERRHVLRTAFAELPQKCRELLALLFADPPIAYAEVSERLGMKIGAIGPNRGRCLDRLRQTQAMIAFTAE